ncbi:MAG: pentapeptide repeat-containing protein [Cetobacterium sp.]
MRKIYKNRVFSYKNKTLLDRNYSRKNFEETINKLVIFKNCIFEQTKLSNSKFEECLLEKCNFKQLEISKVIFENVTFLNCIFDSVLLNECKFISCVFEGVMFENTIIYPENKSVKGYTEKLIEKIEEEKFKQILEKFLMNKFIRESSTVYRKIKKKWSSDLKRSLKKMNKKEEKKMNLSKNERLLENAKRKKLRKKMQKESYENSLLGKNRKLNLGVLNFFLNKYTIEEIEKGVEYYCKNINTSFSNLSILINYIEKSKTYL